MVKIGIIGVGTVGASVVSILENNSNIIQARAGKSLKVVKGVVRDIEKARNNGVQIPLTTDIDEVLNDPEIDIIVELMGGVEKPYEVVTKAFKNKKSVVTANKALLAYHRYELEKLAEDVSFEYEASVAGGIPIITSLRNGLSANHIDSIQGILNGTCNYILTEMIQKGADFGKTLKVAQELGYAEADPTFDISGLDTAHKLLILASISYGIDAKPEDILVEGIEKISSEDIEFSKEFNYNIKLLGIAKLKSNGTVELRVHPALVPNDVMIAKIDGVMNGISVIGDQVGETVYYGAGAGGEATASAVIANIIDIARDSSSTPILGFKKPLDSLEAGKMTLAPKEEISTNYYFRITVEDKAGVLFEISKVLKDFNISIETVLQKPNSEKENNTATLFLTTHQTDESNVSQALKKIKELNFVKEKPFILRIEK